MALDKKIIKFIVKNKKKLFTGTIPFSDLFY